MNKKTTSITILFIGLILLMMLNFEAPDTGASELQVCSEESDYAEMTGLNIKKSPEHQKKQSVTFEQKLKIEGMFWEVLKRQKGHYEVCDYIGLNAEQFMEKIGNQLGMVREGNTITGCKVQFYFGLDGMEKVILRYRLESAEQNKELYVWTIYGISLYEDIDTIKNEILVGSDYSWLQVGSHVLTGLSLQKEGIEYIFVCADEEAIEVRAGIKQSYIEKLETIDFVWRDKIFLYSDPDRQVDIQIKYPEIEISNAPEIAEKINQNILESAFLELPEDVELDMVTNLSIKEFYSIENSSADYVSVRFDGQKRSEGKETIFAVGSTSSLQENGRKLKFEEAAENDEQIAIIEETVLLDDFAPEEKERRIKELRGSYVNYVITPGFIHYFYPPTEFSKDKCVVLPVMREDRVVEYGVGTSS